MNGSLEPFDTVVLNQSAPFIHHDTALQSGDKVRFRPYEAEIRQLLLKHDPG